MPKNSLTASFLFVIWKTFYTEGFLFMFRIVSLSLNLLLSHFACG